MLSLAIASYTTVPCTMSPNQRICSVQVEPRSAVLSNSRPPQSSSLFRLGFQHKMSLRIKAVVDKFVQELQEALDADIQDRIMKDREMQSYIEEREREVAEREAAWKADLSRREAEIARQEARLKMERDNLEKEKSVLMGTASNQDNQDGALEITVSGEKYRCLRFAKAKK
ncbi:uncharacterized protein LOC106769621 isoform X1 [Vigna radiata var. radiata]|uniref:Uncharacterized protein LOC106769621 isoform X1 n=1 Tax=Vigna radiata var. radiata TaxID=3916 RepID=A0A3Q0F9V2_VIGRR|nr:uncharacterized protein LOC106769621 isoform X1 [Vigna radiata var. radiata]XP_022640599.1 uncharacterized protein LOC106769621 isoform X1 [Vigna radiata var. radiata]